VPAVGLRRFATLFAVVAISASLTAGSGRPRTDQPTLPVEEGHRRRRRIRRLQEGLRARLPDLKLPPKMVFDEIIKHCG